MQVIPLNKGQYAVCDASIWSFLMQWNWYGKVQRNYTYAVRHRILYEDNPRELIYMHQAVAEYYGMHVLDGYVLDHINRDALDNRRANLRIVTYAQNALNAKQRASASGYLGVRWDASKARWKGYITVNGKEKFVCYTSDAKTAAMYRDKAVLRYYDNAMLNFPELAISNHKQEERLPPYEPRPHEIEFLEKYKRIKRRTRRQHATDIITDGRRIPDNT